MKNLKIILLLLFIVAMTACDDTVTYKGKNVEYQVIATNSLLGVQGSSSDHIFILENDEFGRILFAYIGYSTNSYKWVLAVLISQKSSSGFSYWYDGINFVYRELSDWNLITEDNVLKQFSPEEIVELKNSNDWNHELQEDKLFKTRIVGRKRDTVSNSKQKEIFDSFSSGFHRNFSTLLTTDRNGQSLYYMRKLNNENDWANMDSYLVMIDKNGRLVQPTGFEKIESIWDYSKQLYEFKKKNDWSFYEK